MNDQINQDPNNQDIVPMKYLGRLRHLRYTDQAGYHNTDPIGSYSTILPANLERFIEEYKCTQKPEIIEEALVSLSKLIIRMMNQEINRYKVLQAMDKQELYNTAFISLHHAMLKFDVSKSSIHSFPRYLQGYIKRDLKKIVDSESELICCGIAGAEFMPEPVIHTAQTDRNKKLVLMRLALKEAIADMLVKREVSQIEIDTFNMRHIDGYSYKEIAEKVGNKTEKAVKCSVSRLLNKLKRKMAGKV